MSNEIKHGLYLSKDEKSWDYFINGVQVSKEEHKAFGEGFMLMYYEDRSATISDETMAMFLNEINEIVESVQLMC